MSLEEYRKRVARLARLRDGKPIFNGTLEHAAVVIENIFAHATDRVFILSGKMNPRAYGQDEVLTETKLFLADGSHRVKILLESADERDLKEHPFFEQFGDYENVEVRTVPQDMQEHYDFHFIVMDGDSYRFEEDKTKHAAIAAFGDEEGAQNLEKIFTILWERGQPTALP